MKNSTKYMAILIGIGLLLSVIVPALAEGTIGDISGVALEEAEEIEDATSDNSVLEEKFTEKANEFYEAIEQIFILYGVSPEAEEETGEEETPDETPEELPEEEVPDEGMYTIGDYEFYFEEKEDGYYFTDVDGNSYYIDSFELPQSVYSHLSQISKTLDKISLALEEDKIGRAFGLLTSLEARMKATERYLEKDATRAELKEQNQIKLQEKLEERERIQQEKQDKKDQDKSNNSNKDNKGNSDKSNNAGGNGNGNSGGNGNGKK